MKLSDWTFSVMFHTLLLLVIPVWLADMLLLRVYFLYPTSLQVGAPLLLTAATYACIILGFCKLNTHVC